MVRHIPCGTFVNESERIACERLRVKLQGAPGEWIILSNLLELKDGCRSPAWPRKASSPIWRSSPSDWPVNTPVHSMAGTPPKKKAMSALAVGVCYPYDRA